MRIIPLILLIILSSISLGMSCAKHGEQRTGKENAGIVLLSWLIQWGLIIWIII